MHHPLVSECNPDHVVKQDDIIIESREKWEFGEFSDVDAITTGAIKHEIKVSQLEFVEVKVDGISARALKDSGAQIPLVSRNIFLNRTLNEVGNVTVQGVFGQPVEAPLVSVGIRVVPDTGSSNVTPELPMVCAVVDMNASDY